MQTSTLRRAILVPPLLFSLPAHAADDWPDTYVTRLEALALMQSLNAELLGSRSATLTLEKWCGSHRMAEPAKVVAKLRRDIDKPAGTEQRRRLQVGPDEPLKFRRVQLFCGDKLLSEADNWYVPSRLTDEMNHLLESTDTPFGKAVLALGTTRQTFGVKVLWSPLPEGWEMAAAPPAAARENGSLDMPEALFEHQALLFTRDKVPFAEVDEVYQRQILAFAPPSR